ncbi:Uncharacterized protein M6B38_226270 [Iris pallida]|uniref:Uncharacterized protein n=1 Tax=Iris pallida TaxID=29817 RepID=A0AAX6DU60_IRIPA|nr:Uncharacterized protein M6B38_226270 [Iris pallida]
MEMSSSSSETETESLVFLAKRTTKKKMKKREVKNQRSKEEEWCSWPKRKSSSGVTLEGYLEGAAADTGSRSSEVMTAEEQQQQQQQQVVVGRTKSLTDEDLDELKGCLDLGFGFSYDEIPELCSTLPALELCYSMSQRFFLDDQQRSQTPPDPSSSSSGDQAAEPPEPTAAPPVANWGQS